MFAAARLFGGGVKQVRRAVVPDDGVRIAVREFSPTHSVFVPNVCDVQACRPPSPDEFAQNTRAAVRWAQRRKAAPIGPGVFFVVVQVKDGVSVVIDNIDVRATASQLVPGIALTQALAGPIDVLSLEIDLNVGRVWCIDANETRIAPIIFSVSSNDPLVMRVSGGSSGAAVLWHLELSMIVNGRAVKRRVPEDDDWITVPHDYVGIQRTYEVSAGSWVSSELAEADRAYAADETLSGAELRRRYGLS